MAGLHQLAQHMVNLKVGKYYKKYLGKSEKYLGKSEKYLGKSAILREI